MNGMLDLSLSTGSCITKNKKPANKVNNLLSASALTANTSNMLRELAEQQQS